MLHQKNNVNASFAISAGGVVSLLRQPLRHLYLKKPLKKIILQRLYNYSSVSIPEYLAPSTTTVIFT
ncbi:MAG: hypothetical protein IJ010_00980, partial [Ruminococcus sp.]|nr:hypothetical protein [Ruminococcus sp.]